MLRPCCAPTALLQRLPHHHRVGGAGRGELFGGPDGGLDILPPHAREAELREERGSRFGEQVDRAHPARAGQSHHRVRELMPQPESAGRQLHRERPYQPPGAVNLHRRAPHDAIALPRDQRRLEMALDPHDGKLAPPQEVEYGGHVFGCGGADVDVHCLRAGCASRNVSSTAPGTVGRRYSTTIRASRGMSSLSTPAAPSAASSPAGPMGAAISPVRPPLIRARPIMRSVVATSSLIRSKSAGGTLMRSATSIAPMPRSAVPASMSRLATTRSRRFIERNNSESRKRRVGVRRLPAFRPLRRRHFAGAAAPTVKSTRFTTAPDASRTSTCHAPVQSGGTVLRLQVRQGEPPISSATSATWVSPWNQTS